MQTTTDLKLIEFLLSTYPWEPDAVKKGAKPFLNAEQAHKRAEMVVEVMTGLGIEWPIYGSPVPPDKFVPYYEIPDTSFGKTDAQDVEEVYKARGVGLTWGSLMRFSRVCEIGRTHFGSNWFRQHAKKLSNTKEHLTFIEEFAWLGPWRNVTNPNYEVKAFSGSNKQVDWRFESCGQIINLEVKSRPKDWMRHVDGPQYNKVQDWYYEDAEGKFPHRNPNELNILAVSSPAAADRSWRLQTEKFLKDHPAVDAVILWAQNSVGQSSAYEIQSEKPQLIELFFDHHDPEDVAYVGMIVHLLRNPLMRRAYKPNEVPAALDEHFRINGRQ